MRLLLFGVVLALLGGCAEAEAPTPAVPPVAQLTDPSPTLIPTFSMPSPTPIVLTTAPSPAPTLIARATSIVASAQPAGEVATAPDLSAVPEVDAPVDLSTVQLPDSRSDIEALFNSLPAAVSNHVRLTMPVREAPGRLSAYYSSPDRTSDSAGLPMVFQAIDVGSALPSELSAAHAIVQLAADHPGTLGRDGENYWFAQEFVAEQDAGPDLPTQYVLSWASSNGEWLYAVLAGSPAERDALLSAVVATVEAQ